MPSELLEVTENSIYSSTTKESFHGTGISLFQHPTYDGEGVDRSIVIDRVSQDVSSKSELMICHTSTLMCPLLMKALRSYLFQLPVTYL